MVNIITGPIDSGKTTKLQKIFNETKKGDGFVLPKIYFEGQNAGQEIVRLSDNNKLPFSRIDGYIPPDWNEKCRIEIYSFSVEGFDYASSIIDSILKEDISPIFIDEIGILELQEKGFYRLLTRILEKDVSVYMAVREPLLDKIIIKFNIKQYNLIRV